MVLGIHDRRNIPVSTRPRREKLAVFRRRTRGVTSTFVGARELIVNQGVRRIALQNTLVFLDRGMGPSHVEQRITKPTLEVLDVPRQRALARHFGQALEPSLDLP